MKKPTLEEVAQYCEERQNGITPSAFLDYYEQVGWVVGKCRKPMKNWQAAVREWERRENRSNFVSNHTSRSWAN